MKVSRRRLLRNCVGAAAACMAGPTLALGQRRSPDISGDQIGTTHVKTPPTAMSREFFAPAVGSGFKVTQASGNSAPVYLRLMKISDAIAIVPPNVGSMAVPPKQTTYTITGGFMLSFYGSFPETLPQGKYTFEHDSLGKFELFIVPDSPNSQYYTAVVAYVGQTLSIGGGTVAPAPFIPPPIIHQPVTPSPVDSGRLEIRSGSPATSSGLPSAQAGTEHSQSRMRTELPQ